jgi:hypothetical protein
MHFECAVRTTTKMRFLSRGASGSSETTLSERSENAGKALRWFASPSAAPGLRGAGWQRVAGGDGGFLRINDVSESEFVRLRQQARDFFERET